MLALLDHNENIGRQQQVKKDGELAWYRVFPRGLPFCQRWKIRPVKEPKMFHFRKEIANAVLRKLYEGDEIRTVDSDVDALADENPRSILKRPTIPLTTTEKPAQESLIAKRQRLWRATISPGPSHAY